MRFIKNFVVIMLVLTALLVYIIAPFIIVALWNYYTYEPMPIYYVIPLFILWLSTPIAIIATVAEEE